MNFSHSWPDRVAKTVSNRDLQLITSIPPSHVDITAGDAASMATLRRAIVGGGKYFIRDADVSIKNARGRGELPRRTPPSPYLSFCFSARLKDVLVSTSHMQRK